MLGGCGAAPAYALARLAHGLHAVDLNTQLGADLFGDLVHHWLVDAGVTTQSPPELGVSTSTHLIHASGAQRRSAFYRGERVDWARSLQAERPDWFLAAGYGLVEPRDVGEMAAVCQQLSAAGTRIAIDPGPWFAQRTTPAQMAPLWSHVDFLIGTTQELAPYVSGAAEKEGGELAQALLELGIGTVVIKEGPAGASWADADGSGHTDTRPVDAACSVGAGDTFNARLLFGLARGDGLSDAVRAAAALATRVVAAGRGVLGAFGDQPAVEGLDPWQ